MSPVIAATLDPSAPPKDASASKRGRGWTGRLDQVGVIASILVLWQAGSMLGWLDERSLPAPTTIVGALSADIRTTELWHAVAASLGAWAAGMALIIVLAVPVGILIGLSSLLYAATNPTLEFIRTIPSASAIPILMFVYGAGFELTVFLVVFSGIWPLLIHTTRGLHDIDPQSIETARAFNIGPVRRFFSVLLPAASPLIFTGLRISAVVGLLMAVGASLIVGGQGLGELIFTAQRGGNVEYVYSRILVTSLLAISVTFALLYAERRLLRWHPSQRDLEFR